MYQVYVSGKIVTPFDKLKSVRMHICTIINEEILHRKEEKLIECLKKVFKPIPHYDKLPADVAAEIKLIDHAKTIKTQLSLSKKVQRCMADLDPATSG